MNSWLIIVLMDNIRRHGEDRPIQSASIELMLRLLLAFFLRDTRTHHQGSFGSTGLFKRYGRCTFLLMLLDRGDATK